MAVRKHRHRAVHHVSRADGAKESGSASQNGYDNDWRSCTMANVPVL